MGHIAQEKHRLSYQAPHFTISDIDLDISLHETNTKVIATSEVHPVSQGCQSLVLDGENMTLESVLINGRPAKHEVSELQLTIFDVPTETFTLQVVTTMNPTANTALEGLYRSGNAFCTQCEAEGFRRITYYLDRPDVLAKFSTTITADSKEYPYLLSNGNKTDSGANDDGTHWVTWEDPFPKPCYLFALVAGDFDVLRDQFTTKSGRPIALELFVDKGNLDRSHHAMESLKKAMAWDEQRFGLEYDLDIYMIVAVDFFNMGAMENKGLNVFNAKYVLANSKSATDTDYFDIERVIGHEYFHNWTGNRITCRDWFQLSLKEGLTVFRDQEFSSDLGSRTLNRIRNVKIIRGPQFAEDASPMSHPIRPDIVMEMNNFYTVTVYEKGSEVIRMMHTLLGEEKFQQGMQLYVQRHDGQAATCDDFVEAMQDASGVDLSLFKRWYSQSGTPILDFTDEYDASTQTYCLNVKQMTPPTAGQKNKQPLHIPLSVSLYDQNGKYLGDKFNQILNVMDSEQSFSFNHVSEKPVIALLQDFSAPVRLNYDYSEHDLLILMQHAKSGFTRWDAAQSLLNQFFRAAVRCHQQNQPLPATDTLVAAFSQILSSNESDKALVAEMVKIPSESTIAELFEQIDVDAIHAVRKHLETEIATHLRDLFISTYAQNKTDIYRVDAVDVAKRDLVAVCLNYLAIHSDVGTNELVLNHYQSADNMTDKLAALSAAKNGCLPCFELMMTDYEKTWKHDGLVMDNWFRLQATRPDFGCLSKVKELIGHESFSMQNPNRVRALIGTFCAANTFAFHAADGSGYDFLLSILETLNQSNPQVASRMITPLLQLKRFDIGRQQKMKLVLEALAARSDLSRDLYEKITKALL